MKFNITKGIQKSAIRLTAYGPEGIGKSTFASEFPDPLYIDVEGGTKQLDVVRFEQPQTWNDLIEMVDAVIDEPTICKTLVIDTVDRAESLLVNQLLEEGKCDSIEKYGGGYGKGYTAMAERFNKDLLIRLDKLIAKGVNVCLIAHAAMRKLESPDEPPYDRWELKVSKKVAPLVKEWSDILVFMTYETLVVEEKGRAKAKGQAKRKMILNHRPTCDAKNRYGLEDDLPLSFEPFREIYEGSVPPAPQPEMLDIENPAEGIVEGDMAEDPRDVLIRQLKNKKVSKKAFEEWLKSSGRLAPDGTYMDLSGSAVNSMIENIDVLIEQIKGGK